jgi:hypothetical protein
MKLLMVEIVGAEFLITVIKASIFWDVMQYKECRLLGCYAVWPL